MWNDKLNQSQTQTQTHWRLHFIVISKLAHLFGAGVGGSHKISSSCESSRRILSGREILSGHAQRWWKLIGCPGISLTLRESKPTRSLSCYPLRQQPIQPSTTPMPPTSPTPPTPPPWQQLRVNTLWQFSLVPWLCSPFNKVNCDDDNNPQTPTFHNRASGCWGGG